MSEEVLYTGLAFRFVKKPKEIDEGDFWDFADMLEKDTGIRLTYAKDYYVIIGEEWRANTGDHYRMISFNKVTPFLYAKLIEIKLWASDRGIDLAISDSLAKPFVDFYYNGTDRNCVDIPWSEI